MGKRKKSQWRIPVPKRCYAKNIQSLFYKDAAKLIRQQALKTADEAAQEKTIEQLSNVRWNVHANAPFGGPAQILEYLGRYTHKTAITVHRITEITETEMPKAPESQLRGFCVYFKSFNFCGAYRLYC